jgi:CRP-like cAMP-binding protein
MTARPVHETGPSLRATPAFEAIGDGVAERLLTPPQRRLLASLSTRVTLPPRATVYREGAVASAVFICARGVLKAYRDLPSGRRRVTAFLFPQDLFGLAHGGHYSNTVQALTQVNAFRLPLDELRTVLKRDGELEFQFLTKLVHEIRELQLRTIVMGRRSAAGRLAMFVQMLQRKDRNRPGQTQLTLPMSRSDIADYLGLSLEAVSRGSRTLIDAGIIAFDGRSQLKILDNRRLEKIANDV